MSVIETDVLVVPLGVRLHDNATGATVADGLELTLVPHGGRPTAAVRTPSGVFAVHPAGSPAGGRLEVRDPTGRFFAFATDVELPAERLIDLPLFSRPGRPVPAGAAAVRAQLAHETTLEPAAFAALDVAPQDGAPPVRGIADERGGVLVVFPWPEPPVVPGRRIPLSATRFTVGVSVSRPRTTGPLDALPTLDTLTAQIPATLVTAPPSTELDSATLRYGRESVLRSSNTEARVLVRQEGARRNA